MTDPKIFQSYFEVFSSIILKDATPSEVASVRAAFFAGGDCLFKLLKNVLPKLSQQGSEAILNSLDAEFNEFSAEMTTPKN